MKIYNEEENRQLQNAIKSTVSIVEYARMLGYTPKRVGRYYSLKEHDSVIIDDDRNCFWRNSDASKNAKGSIIDFVVYFKEVSLHEALLELTEMVQDYNYLSIEPIKQKPIPKDKEELVLPKKADSKRNIYAYLNKSRGISTTVINDFIINKNLYQDTYNNCVFVSYDKENKPEFCCKRGTHTEKRFVSDVIGSNYDKCFCIENGSEHLIVTESVIDAMSVMTIMERQNRDYKAYNYQSLSGTQKWESTLNVVKNNPSIKTITLALDNDSAGKSAIYEIKNAIQMEGLDIKCLVNLPQAKDWNQELINRLNEEKEIHEKGTKDPVKKEPQKEYEGQKEKSKGEIER